MSDPILEAARATGEPSELIDCGGSRDRKLLVPPSSLVALPSAEVVEALAKEPPTP